MPVTRTIALTAAEASTLDDAFADWDAKEGLLAATFVDFLRRHGRR